MIELTATTADAGKRLDHLLAERLTDYSRARLQEWIKAGRVLVNGRAGKPSLVIRGGEAISVEPAALPSLNAFAEDLPLKLLYEDAAVLAIDKAPGVVVHAGAGRHSGTLVNALLHHFPALQGVGADERPGIVHRIDRDTSGVLLVARTASAHRSLAAQFASRTVAKTYLALVHGVVPHEHGRVETPIERDPVRRTRMTTRTGKGRAALTVYRVLARYEGFTYLEVDLHTGRTHQIRVHLASVGFPLAGDVLYGGRVVPGLARTFLHAHRIGFTSPASGRRVEVTAPLASDLAAFLASLPGTLPVPASHGRRKG